MPLWATEKVPEIVTALATIALAVVSYYALRQVQHGAQQLKQGAEQLRLSSVIARHDFLFKFFQFVQTYNPIHIELEDANWAPDPKDRALENQLGRYLGLFEGLELLIEDGIFKIDEVDKLYSHRLVRIARNVAIKKRRENETKRLKILNRLLDVMSKQPVFISLMDGEKDGHV